MVNPVQECLDCIGGKRVTAAARAALCLEPGVFQADLGVETASQQNDLPVRGPTTESGESLNTQRGVVGLESKFILSAWQRGIRSGSSHLQSTRFVARATAWA